MDYWNIKINLNDKTILLHCGYIDESFLLSEFENLTQQNIRNKIESHIISEKAKGRLQHISKKKYTSLFSELFMLLDIVEVYYD